MVRVLLGWAHHRFRARLEHETTSVGSVPASSPFSRRAGRARRQDFCQTRPPDDKISVKLDRPTTRFLSNSTSRRQRKGEHLPPTEGICFESFEFRQPYFFRKNTSFKRYETTTKLRFFHGS
jgi:hypothetical protein